MIFDYGVLEIPITDVPIEYKATTIAGWNYHGGSGTGHVDYELSSDYELELDLADRWKMHNWLFAPQDAVQLLFDAKVDVSSSDDKFWAELSAYGTILNRSYNPVSLRSERGWTTYAVDLSQFAGSVFRFDFLIEDPPGWSLLNPDTWMIDSQVRIDNVRFSHIPIPEPCAVVLWSMGALALIVWRRRREIR